jgi:ferric-dicitrate binding protein FerR (iron transport regulator)
MRRSLTFGRRGSRAALLFALFLGAVAPGALVAKDPAWKAVAASGLVETSSALDSADWRKVTRGDGVAALAAVRTGRAGRVTLTRGADILMIDPQSILILPASADASTVEQRSGSVLYEVDGRLKPDFKVVTPYLVAGVKGTSFVVTVDHRGTSVAVRHGVVEVVDPTNGDRLSLGAGEAVMREIGRPELDRVSPQTVGGPRSEAQELASATSEDSEKKTDERTEGKSGSIDEPARSPLASRDPGWFDAWPNADAHGQAYRRALDAADDTKTLETADGTATSHDLPSTAGGETTLTGTTDDAPTSETPVEILPGIDPPAAIDVPPVLPIDDPVGLPPVVGLPPIDVTPIGLPPIELPIDDPISLPPVHLSPK